MPETSTELAALGGRLRSLRSRRRLSLRDAGARAGLSPSFVGALERGETEIAITRLMRLAEIYGVTVADLVADLNAPEGRLHVPLSDCRVATADEGRIEIFYPPAPAGFAQPFRLVLHPGAAQDGFMHGTPEIHHCVAGRTEIMLGADRFELAPGDTVFVPAGVAHGWSNIGSTAAVLVGTVTPPDQLPPSTPSNGSVA